MSYLNTQPLAGADDAYFRTSLLENVSAVVDSLAVISEELDAMEDECAARFFDDVGAIVRHFVTTWRSGQDTRFATRTMRFPSG